MAYGVIRTDRLHGSDNSADLVSVRYSPAGTDTIIENGNVVLLGALETTNREVYVGATPARDSALSLIAIMAAPEIVADERLKSLADFRNVAGVPARGYMLRSGDIFSVTTESLTEISGTAPAIGQIVELVAGIKLQLVASLTAGSTKVGTIIQIEGLFIVIRVV
jgi:hypothetical protein